MEQQSQEQQSQEPRSRQEPTWWRRRRWRVAGAVIALAAAAVWLSGGGAPVGHFRSGDAAERFFSAYDAAMAELPEPDTSLDIRTSFGIVRAYGFEGDGDGAPAAPLVLLPGRAAASPMWADNLPSLLEVGDVWTLDLLGEPGRSVQQVPIEDDADQARWLAEALAGLPAEEVHLVGVSIGGWTALNLATRQPEGIASVTVLDPVFAFADLSLEAVVRSIPVAFSWAPQSWRDAFNSWTAGGAPVEDVPVADMIEAGMSSYRLALPAPSRIPESALEDLQMPVLAIIAGQSVMHDADAAAAVAREALDPGQVEVYDDASHAINGEHPDRIADDIEAFLDDIG